MRVELRNIKSMIILREIIKLFILYLSFDNNRDKEILNNLKAGPITWWNKECGDTFVFTSQSPKIRFVSL